MEELTPRCLNCGYVLLGLPEGQCPECGRPFDPAEPATFSTKPLFVRWRFWLPGVALAAFGGLILYVLLLAIAGWGVATSLVAPFCVGAIVGYGAKVGPLVLIVLALGVLGGVVMGLYGLGFLGVFCGTVAAIVALIPILLGAGCGLILRLKLRESHFDQRWYLPMLFLLIPLTCAVMERAFATPRAVESVVTSVDIPAPVGRAWNGIMTYEEVHRRPPWLLRYGLPRPLYTHGSMARVGDTKVCVYSKGHLTKRITERVTQARLAFEVVEQDRIETDSVKLLGGSFEFHSLDLTHTRVDLITTYQPKLGPRFIWRPFERLAVHSLHRHVLAGMQDHVLEEAARQARQSESK
jgi:rRNA maturation protein Nop10